MPLGILSVLPDRRARRRETGAVVSTVSAMRPSVVGLLDLEKQVGSVHSWRVARQDMASRRTGRPVRSVLEWRAAARKVDGWPARCGGLGDCQDCSRGTWVVGSSASKMPAIVPEGRFPCTTVSSRGRVAVLAHRESDIGRRAFKPEGAKSRRHQGGTCLSATEPASAFAGHERSSPSAKEDAVSAYWGPARHHMQPRIRYGPPSALAPQISFFSGDRTRCALLVGGPEPRWAGRVRKLRACGIVSGCHE